MSTFKITGGTPLYGSVRLGGAKNASFKLMIASLLGTMESRLLNFSHISEISTAAEVIRSLGGKVTQRGERALFIDPRTLDKFAIPDQFGAISRSSPMYIPVLLHKFHQAIVPQPGGDQLGTRPLGWHFEAMEKMGATIEESNNHIIARCDKLHGIKYKFPKNSHTGTETLIMAAVLAQGKTTIENAALEPEVDDLIAFLNNLGGRIKRRHYRIIEIEGVDALNGTIHKIMPDRNEAVSYACAAIASKGDIVVENAEREHLQAFLDVLEEMGAGYEIGNFGIRFYYQNPLGSADIITQPEPGFMTDWQPLFAVLATQAVGESIIHEAVFPSRFQYIEHLNQMGVKTEFFNPDVDNPEKIYNFTQTKDSPHKDHAVKIIGPCQLNAGEFNCQDLRHGATMVLAALIASGTSYIHQIEQIDRGYEDLDGRLRSMGAQIERIN